MSCINIVAFKKYAKMKKSFMIFPWRPCGFAWFFYLFYSTSK